MGKQSTSVMTLLFTDIEGSTALLQRAGAQWVDLLDRHRVIIRAAIEEHSGIERGTEASASSGSRPAPGPVPS